MRIWLLLAFLLSTTVAHARDIEAEERAATRKVFDAQIAALKKGDGSAFARTFAKTDVAVLLPGARVATSPAAIAAAVTTWLGTKPTLALVGEPKIGLGSNGAYLMAELTWTRDGIAERVRMTELVVGLGSGRTPEGMALMISRAVPDNKLVGAKPGAKPGKIDKGDLAARMTAPKKLLAELHRYGDSDNIAVIGTTAAEVALGDVAGKKLLEKWQNLKLTVVGTPLEAEDDQMMGYALGQVSMARGRKPPVTFDVLLIGLHDIRQDGTRPWWVMSIHYGAANAP